MWGFNRKLTGLEKRDKGRALAARGVTGEYTRYQVEWALITFEYNNEGLFGTFEDIATWALDEDIISLESYLRVVESRQAMAAIQGRVGDYV